MNKTAAALLILCLLSAAGLLGQEAVDPAGAEPPLPRFPPRKRPSPATSRTFSGTRPRCGPLRSTWTGRASYLCGTVLVATGVLVANDEGIYENFKTFQGNNPWVDKVSPAVTMLGDWGVDCGIAGLFFLGGVIAQGPQGAGHRADGLGGAAAYRDLVPRSSSTWPGASAPGSRTASITGTGPSAFFKRYSQDFFSRYDSFFSGHTVSAWSLATVIAENYKNRLWVPITCYGLATLVGLSRLTEDDHWLSDVFVGAVVGFAVGKMVVRNQNKRLQVSPSLSAGGIGLAFSYGSS